MRALGIKQVLEHSESRDSLRPKNTLLYCTDTGCTPENSTYTVYHQPLLSQSSLAHGTQLCSTRVSISRLILVVSYRYSIVCTSSLKIISELILLSEPIFISQHHNYNVSHNQLNRLPFPRLASGFSCSFITFLTIAIDYLKNRTVIGSLLLYRVTPSVTKERTLQATDPL